MAIRGRESFLCGIFGVRSIAEDPVARPNERDRFALDETADRFMVAGQHGADDRAFVQSPPGSIQ